MSNKFYHGYLGRDNNFWAYPRHKQLENSRWNTSNADDLRDNYTFLGTNSSSQL